jgi:hypothetical protein
LLKPPTRNSTFFTDSFGEPESTHLNVVTELPDDTLPAAYAPELAAIQGSRVGDKSGIRLLANTIAHQWWGCEISPRTLGDAWITNGMSRYGELMYVEDQSGKSALKAALEDVAAGALAYDTVPLSSTSRLDPFSPQFQSMTLEKGAMIFHMLRGEVGDKAFLNILKGALSQYTDGSIRTEDFEKVSEAEPAAANSPSLRNGSTAPALPALLTSTPSIASATTRASAPSARFKQDLDLFRMPDRPPRRNRRQDRSPEDRSRRHRHAVRRGHLWPAPPHQRRSRRLWCSRPPRTCRCASPSSRASSWWRRATWSGALAEYKKALDANPQSSLASYRIGEVLFTPAQLPGQR